MNDSQQQDEVRMRRALQAIEQLQARLAKSEQASREAIAVVGMACRFPGNACDPNSLWKLLETGQDAMGRVPIDRWNADEYYDPRPATPGKMISRDGGFLHSVRDFDAAFFGISPKEAASVDPQQRMLLEVSWEAMERSGILPQDWQGERIGVFAGMSSHDYSRNLMTRSPTEFDAYLATGNSHSVAAGRISYSFGFTGPSMAVDTACSSSLVAVHLACQSLRNQECIAALAGGVNLILSPDLSITFSQARMLSPDGRCKTFSASADGFARSEGCGVIVLKRVSDAIADGNQILAVIRGSAVNQDGRSGGLTIPNGPSQQAVIRNALGAAGVTAEQIDYLEAHGTGTELGDPIELGALAAVFGKSHSKDRLLNIGSIKTNLGHMEAAAGIGGLIKVVLALQHGVLPKQLHCEQKSKHIDWNTSPLRVTSTQTTWQKEGPRFAGVSSFGFSGTNAHVVLESAAPIDVDHQDSGEGSDTEVAALMLSTKDETSLKRLALEYANRLEAGADWFDTCWSAFQHRTKFAYRLAIVADSGLEAARQIREAESLTNGFLSTLPNQNSTEAVAAHKISKAFVQGEEVDWPGRQGKQVDIPTYTFNRKPHWIHTNPMIGSTSDTTNHRMLGVPITPARSEKIYLEGSQAIFRHERWQQHRVFDKPVLPAVGFVEMAIEAVLSNVEESDSMTLSDFIFTNPLPLIDPNSKLQVICNPINEEFKIEVVSQIGGGVWKTNSQTTARLGGESLSSAATTAQRIEQVCRSGKAVSPHAIYHRLSRQNVEYGLPWKIIRSAQVIENQVVATIAAQSIENSPYCFDPIVLDACIQSLAALFLDDNLTTSFLPASVGRVTACRPSLIGNQFLVYATIDTGTDWLTANISLCSEDKCPLITFEELLLRPVEQVHFQDATSSAEISASAKEADSKANINRSSPRDDTLADWLYQLEWQRQPLPTQTQTALASQIIEERQPKLHQRLKRPEETLYLRMMPLLEDYAKLRAQQIVASTDPEQVCESQRFFLNHLVKIQHPPTFRLSSPDHEKEDFRQIFANELRLLDRCAEHANAVIAGQQKPLDILFPNGDSSDVAWLYEHSTGAKLMNDQVFEILKAVVNRLQRPLRILEIGAGTGGTTSRLLPLLNEVNEYVFTDISPLLVDRGQRQFSDQSNMTFRVLDIESAPNTQGFAPQSFDIILAANVLHATSDLRQALANVTELLAPSGQLVMLEGTQSVAWLDLIFGLTNGWWLFKHSNSDQTDPRLERNHPLLPPQAWQTLLSEVGLSSEVLTSETLPQAILLSEYRGERDEQNPHTEARLVHANRLLQQHQQQQLRAELKADQVVFFAADQEKELDVSLQKNLGELLKLTQELISGEAPFPQLTVITRGATGPTCHQPIQGALFGFARTIELEHPELRVRRLDLDPLLSGTDQYEQLCAELNSRTTGAIAYRDGHRLIGRLERVPVEQRLPDRPKSAYELRLDKQSPDAGIQILKTDRRSPQDDEVEIRVAAAGVNFIDVLDVSGMLPFERDWLGGECAGTVVAIGDQVKQLKRGDRVVCLAPGTFRQFVTVAEVLVERIDALPSKNPMTFDDAAAIPANVLTAELALCQVAKLKAGERILIQAAAGGTGMAAVKLAQRLGAEIYATASRHKWAALRANGIEHIFDSRTTEFANPLMQLTKGKGVNVVINSLSGEHIEKGLSVLAPQGRFIEIGKRNIWTDAQVSNFRPDVIYSVVDLMSASESAVKSSQDNPRRKSIFGRLGSIPEGIPKTRFPVEEAPRAIRYMQQANHIGKVLLSFNEPSVPVSGEASYLITGGLGGLGLETADWLLRSGAKQIFLLGRQIPDKLPIKLKKMIQAHANIELVECDVSNRLQMAEIVRRVNATNKLRGVIHAAGVLKDATLQQLSWEDLREVLRPKVHGGYHLHELTKTLPLDFFILYSSAASLLGSPGQASHIAANSYLDALAHHRRNIGLPAQCINWGPWSQIGSASQESTHRQLQARGIDGISPAQGIKALELLIQRPDLTQVGVVPIDWSRMRATIPAIDPLLSSLLTNPTKEQGRSTNQPETEWTQALLGLPQHERLNKLSELLRSELGKVLGYSSANPPSTEIGFFDLGMDSLMSVELKSRLSRKLGIDISPTLIFKHPNISALAPQLLARIDDGSSQSIQATGNLETRMAEQASPPSATMADRQKTESDQIAAELAALDKLLEDQ